MKDKEFYNLPIGECFELYGKKYKVVESIAEKNSEGEVTFKPDCCDCAFEDEELACCFLKGEIPECISSRRKDGKLVIFMEATEDEK